MLEAAFIIWSYTGEIPSRLGARILNPVGDIPGHRRAHLPRVRRIRPVGAAEGL